jgi:hypothetical protein
MKLNQLIALLKGEKTTAKSRQTEIYQRSQKVALFSGLSRVFSPRDDEGYVYPSESQAVQQTASKLLIDFKEVSSRYIDLAAAQDWANTTAKASVVVDGQTILADVPVSYLLFLEKSVLVDLKTFVQSIPVLTLDSWTKSPTTQLWETEGKQTVKTKKVMKAVVLYEATTEHPAQVEKITEDVVEGTWLSTSYSGALSKAEKDRLLTNIQKLHDAVVLARTQANEAIAQDKKVAKPIFDFVFSGLE